MTSIRRTLVVPLAAAALLGSALQAGEAKISGKLTTTEDDALYGIAIIRKAPDAGSETLAQLIPGSKVTVFPDTSPEGWWYIEMASNDGGAPVTGYVPRSFVKVVKGPFADVSGDHWAAGALDRLKGTGFLEGYKDGQFNGDKAFTRFEMAVILDRTMDRMKKARERIESMIAGIPVKTNLAGDEAKALDDVVARLDSLSKEEARIQGFMKEIKDKVQHQDLKLQHVDQEVAALQEHDQEQDRRIDEIGRKSSELAADIEALKKSSGGNVIQQANLTGSSGKNLTATLATNIVRLKELMARAENLEAKVAALEARDRLASLLLKDGTRRSSIANLAQRIDKLEGKAVGM